ncbi:MAG: serine protease [bacterium]|nr:serine protease [bacterium]
MTRRLLLFLSMLMLLASVFVLIFKDTKGLNRLATLGAQMAVPRQSNQPGKCVPPNYVFPKETLISDEPLPKKVENSFKNTINITACFSINDRGIFFSGEPVEFGGTGSMFEPGLFISARHIFLVAIAELNQRGRPFFIDKDGLPHSDSYRYTFYGTANINGRAVTFPLELLAMGDPYRPKDLAVFRAMNPPAQLTPLEFGLPANLGDIVYSSGRVASFNPIDDDLNPIRKKILSDFINFNFKGHVVGIVTEMPNNAYTGFKKIYNIRTALEPGFSGGPVLDKNGKIIGLTISVTPGLTSSHAISAEDQELFIRELRDKGIIPKK